MTQNTRPPGAGLTDATGRGAQSAPKKNLMSPQATRAETPNDTYPEDPSGDQFQQWMLAALAAAPSWLISMCFHVVMLLALALWAVGVEEDSDNPNLVAQVDPEEVFEEDFDLDETIIDPIDIPPVELDVPEIALEDQIASVDPNEMAAPVMTVDVSPFGTEATQIGDSILVGLGGPGHGHTITTRRDITKRPPGVTPEHMKAIQMALRWIAEHQLPDGGWSFNHTACPRCQGQCRNPGSAAAARAGATGMALLPLLGAGQTHKTGTYRSTVKNGLYYLVNRMKFDPAKGGSFHEAEGRMYSHGLASIALCEAYAMTHDKGLHNPAQAAINFICYAQAADGGWRYSPKQAGDTSVVGWQIMALKSGHLAYLRVPPQVVKGAERFLDKVQARDGAQYGYTSPATGRPTTSSIGLICRMLLGWDEDNPALQAGAQQIGDWGFRDDVYYNYYASQVLNQLGGERWKNWYATTRDRLIETQMKEGHETGSWYSGGAHGHGNDRGGRLYHSAMNTMTLEVDFRTMPLYQKDATNIDFEE